MGVSDRGFIPMLHPAGVLPLIGDRIGWFADQATRARLPPAQRDSEIRNGSNRYACCYGKLAYRLRTRMLLARLAEYLLI